MIIKAFRYKRDQELAEFSFQQVAEKSLQIPNLGPKH
jgi:hypothetical protein